MTDHVFVITVYKESPYLEQCIQSLINQTVKSEIVMATSTPTAYSRQLAKAYDIPYFVNDSGQTGIAADWNFALANAHAKFATIAHQDDIYDACYWEMVSQNLRTVNAKNVLIAFTDYTDLIKDKTRAVSLNSVVKKSLLFPFAFKKLIKSEFLKKAVLLFGDPICCPSVTFNMEALSDFKFSTEYKCALDWYAWYILAQRHGAFLFINKKLIQHRIHTDSETTAQLNNGIRKTEEQQIFEIMWGKPLAKVIASIYAIGHKSNSIT
ncbi:MAG: glycosyltransferase family A protein [Mucilaginibacter sp.]